METTDLRRNHRRMKSDLLFSHARIKFLERSFVGNPKAEHQIRHMLCSRVVFDLARSRIKDTTGSILAGIFRTIEHGLME
jgi:hypothetical protein